MPLDAFYGYPFEGYPFDSLFAGGNFSGSEYYPRLVAVFFVLLSRFAMSLNVNLCGFAPVVRRVAVGH